MSIFTFLKRMAGDGLTDNKNLSPQEFIEHVTKKDIIIDVRMPREFQEQRVKGAINHDVSSSGFKKQIDSLNRDRTYYLYCRSGNRSGTATKIMRQSGFENVYNIGALNSLKSAGVKCT